MEELEALLRAEMDNVVNGVFRGPRYETFEQRLTRARADRDAALTALAARHRDQANRFAANLAREQMQARADLVNRSETRRRALHNGDLDDDERTQDPRIVALMNMAQAVIGWQLTAPQFVFVFALFISLVIELGIVLAFDTVTLAVLPALTVQHREQVTTEAMVAEMQGAAEREELRHREAMERVRNGADRAMERAEVGTDASKSTWSANTAADAPSHRKAA